MAATNGIRGGWGVVILQYEELILRIARCTWLYAVRYCSSSAEMAFLFFATSAGLPKYKLDTGTQHTNREKKKIFSRLIFLGGFGEI